MLVGMDARRLAALRVDPVRRLLRGLPGEDQHPRGARPPAPRGGGPGTQAPARERLSPSAWRCARWPASSPTGGCTRPRSAPAGSAQWPLVRDGDDPPPARAARRLDGGARPARRCRRRASATGGAERSVSAAREEILGRIRAALARRPGTASARRRRGGRATTAAHGDRSPASSCERFDERLRRLQARGARALRAGGAGRRRRRGVRARWACAASWCRRAAGARWRPRGSRADRGRRADATRARRQSTASLTGCAVGDRRDRDDRARRRRPTAGGARSRWCPTTTSASSAPTRSSSSCPRRSRAVAPAVRERPRARSR